MPPSSKSCSVCRLVKSLDQFSPMPRGYLKRAASCRQCCRDKAKAKANERHLSGDYLERTDKTCTICKVTKPVQMFYKHRRTSDGYMERCKVCHGIDCTKIRKATKAKVIAGYGGKCECCGESRPEFMTIDHKNNDGNKERKKYGRLKNGKVYLGYATYIIYRKLIHENFPRDRYRLLCYNCNCARGAFGYCPHERENKR